MDSGLYALPRIEGEMDEGYLAAALTRAGRNGHPDALTVAVLADGRQSSPVLLLKSPNGAAYVVKVFARENWRNPVLADGNIEARLFASGVMRTLPPPLFVPSIDSAFHHPRHAGTGRRGGPQARATGSHEGRARGAGPLSRSSLALPGRENRRCRRGNWPHHARHRGSGEPRRSRGRGRPVRGASRSRARRSGSGALERSVRSRSRRRASSPLRQPDLPRGVLSLGSSPRRSRYLSRSFAPQVTHRSRRVRAPMPTLRLVFSFSAALNVADAALVAPPAQAECSP